MKIARAAALLLAVGGLCAVAAPVATAATSSCGPSCVDYFSTLYGTTAAPGFVLDSYNQGQTVGTPIVLSTSAQANPGEDFVVQGPDPVSDYFEAGLVSQGVDDYYGNLDAFEIDYSPLGAPTGLCMGVGTAPGNGTPVTLQPCGVSAKTLWIGDPGATDNTLISGATAANFAHPPVLTVTRPGLPLITFASQSIDATGFPDQLWGTKTGELPAHADASESPFGDLATPTAGSHEAMPSTTETDRALGAPAVAPGPATAYIADLIADGVAPLDVPSGSAGGPNPIAGYGLPSGQFPDAVAITPSGNAMYVAGGTGDAVTPVPLPNGAPSGQVSIGGWAYAVAITPDGKTVYVTDFNNNSVVPITVSTNTAGTPIGVGAGPDALAVTPDGTTAYVANFDDGTVSPIDVANNTAGTAISAGQEPSAIAITPDGKTAYVTNYSAHTVTPIDISSNTAGTPIPVGGGPDAVAITPDGTTAYVANSSDGTVTPIDIASNTAGTPIPVGLYPDGVTVTPDGTTTLVTNFFDGTVTPISVATNTPETAIPVGAGPSGLAVQAALQIGNDASLPPATLGSAYTQLLWSVAGTTPFTYALTNGSLPQGLHLSSSGVLSGTPTEQQTETFTIQVTDTSTTAQVATKVFTLSVQTPPAVMTQPTDQTTTAGSGATFTVAFSGNPAPTIQWQVSTGGGTTWTDIIDATSATLTVSDTTTSQSGNRYRALGSNVLSSNVASSSATLTVKPAPPPGSPLSITAPRISGTPKNRQKLTCGKGSWTNDPTSYGYQWSRDGTPIKGATGSTYTVAVIDEGNTLTCTVTATNQIGTSSGANSGGASVSVPFVAHCPAATGSLSGTTLGLVKLGMTVKQARRAYTHSSDRGQKYKDFFCLTPFGVRVAYASPKLLKTVSRGERHKLSGRVVWISTDNARYAVHGIRAGSSLQAAERELRHGYYFRVGVNYWYLAPAGAATAVLKVRNEVVDEVGIADEALTGSHKADRTLMTSFD